MGTGCPNLRQLFGEQYRISWEESRQGRSIDPWLYVIPGRHGHIYPWGSDTLAAYTTRHRTTVNNLRAAGCVLWQDGDQEHTLLFPVRLFPLVAKAIGAYRKKRPSVSQLNALRAQALRNKLASSSLQTPSVAQGCTNEGQLD